MTFFVHFGWFGVKLGIKYKMDVCIQVYYWLLLSASRWFYLYSTVKPIVANLY